jgi:type IV secretory pathway ATPase VirB11/archaellum biosynthesis ATPase
VGALVEETDIRDINTYKSQVSLEHQEIIDTYDNLLCGSRNHLRSFAKQIESLTGSTYATQVPELDAEVKAILSSDQERCGK